MIYIQNIFVFLAALFLIRLYIVADHKLAYSIKNQLFKITIVSSLTISTFAPRNKVGFNYLTIKTKKA